MRIMFTVIVAAALSLPATVCLAQPAIDAPGGPPSAKAPVVQLAREFRATELVGGVVFNKDDERLGVIDDVMIGPEGNVTAVVMATGGILGFGQREVALLYNALDAARDGNGRVRLKVNTDPSILDQLPTYRAF